MTEDADRDQGREIVTMLACNHHTMSEPGKTAPFPPELVGIVAHLVASSGHEKRQQNLVACRLVCRTFAQEFRPYLFRTLRIHDVGGSDGRVSPRHKILQENPSNCALVKSVSVALSPSGWIEQDSSLAEILGLLTSVTTLSLCATVPSTFFSFDVLSRALKKAIDHICALESFQHLNLDSCTHVPPALYLSSPKVKKVTIHDVYFAELPLPEDGVQHPLDFSLGGESSTMSSSPSFLASLRRARSIKMKTSWGAVRLGDVATILKACPTVQTLEIGFKGS
jgi:hypothetical protein